MPLLISFYSLSGDSISVTYKIWEGSVDQMAEPTPVPAGTLEADVGKGSVSYAPSEVKLADAPALAALLLTVTLEPPVDGGTTLFSVLLPKFANQQSPGAFVQVEAVAIVTQVRAGLNVVSSGPVASHAVTVLKGTYSCELPT